MAAVVQAITEDGISGSELIFAVETFSVNITNEDLCH